MKGPDFSCLPLPLHTIDIFLYACDTNIDTKHYTARATWAPLHFRLNFLLELFIDKQRKAVGQGATIKATQAS